MMMMMVIIVIIIIKKCPENYSWWSLTDSDDTKCLLCKLSLDSYTYRLIPKFRLTKPIGENLLHEPHSRMSISSKLYAIISQSLCK